MSSFLGSASGLCAIIWLLLIYVIGQTHAARPKVLGFRDPNTNYLYTLTSLNATRSTPESPHRSLIKVSRVKLDDRKQPVGQPEVIQTLQFTPALVDFDLNCLDSHCYLVTVTSRTRRNVELFNWQRTQFDSSSIRDSFARPYAVKLFGINSGFYIAIAQDQLHLSPYRYSFSSSDDEEPTRFMGCVVLKFIKGHEQAIKYHQFIRLPFNPRHVNHFTTVSSNNVTDSKAIVGPSQTHHHLVFSAQPNWADQEADNVRSFIWSPINDYFWPYRMPRGAEVVQLKPGGTHVLKLPDPQQLLVANLTNQRQQQDYIGSVETCFYQLQRLLADRDLEARRMIESSKSIWRTPDETNPYTQMAAASLTNITAQVIVHGNVIVMGSVIDSPQISIIGANRPSQAPTTPQAPPNMQQVDRLVNSHSPAIVDNKFKQALFKLGYIREKLSRAVLADIIDGVGDTFYSQIRFFGGLEVDEVIFHGIANSNVRLNEIPFKQLQNELVSLVGSQNIGGRVVFDGKVVADRLEIHGIINDHCYLRDAIDIASDRIQIIETTSQDYAQTPGSASVDFTSVSAPDVILSYNATINSIRLGDFITRDNRTQLIVGRKTFKHLSVAKLNLAHHSVQLNDLNISRIARNAIPLRPDQPYQIISSNHQASFMKSITVSKLTINSIVNQHINISSLIHDSIKTNTYEIQQIFGRKNFLNGLKVNRLNTEGALNGIEVGQIFNLNSMPPIPEQHRALNTTTYNSLYDVPITGEFIFRMPVGVSGNVNANLVNGVDLTRRAIRRLPPGLAQSSGDKPQYRPQIVRGHKIFYRPLRILNDIRLVDLQKASAMVNNASRISYPLINGIDMRAITAGLARQMQQPPPISVENLEIEGNLDIPTQADRNGTARAFFGNYSSCPLDLVRSRVVLAGAEDQVIDTPIRVNSLRAKSILVEPSAMNGVNFPSDFVMRTAPSPKGPISTVEPVYGIKTIQHLVVSTAMVSSRINLDRAPDGLNRGVVLEGGASINQVPYSELQTFMAHERKLNSTGEKVFSTMNVYGNLHSKRINGYYWPEDILLRSVSSTPGIQSTQFLHKRIYSHLIFANTSSLRVENQLVLRGPIQLNGRMNGVNLTEFSRQSATYGDKDLYSNSRPIRNKNFMGGLTVRGEIRSQGFIDGVNVDEMKHRVVRVGPMGNQQHVTGPKIFTDVLFDGPVRMIYFNNMPMDNYLSRIQFEPDGITLRVHNKKTITGALRINKNLYVRGLINGIDFPELKARAISLAPTEQDLTFNKTLIVEGDVFMDNLWIDERNGTIDGVKLKNLLQIGPFANEEFNLTNPQISRVSNPYGRSLKLTGYLMDCQLSCEMQPVAQQLRSHPSTKRSPSYEPNIARPVVVPAQPVMAYTSQPLTFNQRNYTLTRTTPPYSLASSYQPPMVPTPTPRPVFQARPPQIQQLVNRRPVSVRYEQRAMAGRQNPVPDRSSIVAEQLENLRRRIVSINLVRLAQVSNLVVGFIDAPTNDVSTYTPREHDLSHYDHLATSQKSYMQLDQIDFPFRPTIYHLSVGVATDRKGQNVTSVSSSLRGSTLRELSVLPVEFPNSAMFISIPEVQTLFLLISQDRSMNSEMCPATGMIRSTDRYVDGSKYYDGPSREDNGVHVYLFHALQNSSSLTSAYFDLYQTIDLPGVDSFDKFTFRSSSYVLAISRALNRIYLLLLRGYTGFQVVSYIDAPMIESVSIMQSTDGRPVLVIHQTSGVHRIMEAVVI